MSSLLFLSVLIALTATIALVIVKRQIKNPTIRASKKP